MITKVVIRNANETPMSYVKNVFKNGRTFNFKPGVNVVIGENGSGKTTLFKLIETYCIVGTQECDVKALKRFTQGLGKKGIPGGVDVYGDYVRNIFRLNRADEDDINGESIGLKGVLNFRDLLNSKRSSTGECIVNATASMFERIFSPTAKLGFPLKELDRLSEYYSDIIEKYKDYIEKHRVECEEEFTLLMDEPDNNLDMKRISELRSILSFHKENTQLIVIIHNPLLICWAMKQKHINIVELTKGYGKKVMKFVDEYTK